jgi:hypothetical protein
MIKIPMIKIPVRILAGLGVVAALIVFAPQPAASKTGGLRNAEQIDASAQRRRVHYRHHHYRHHHWRRPVVVHRPVYRPVHHRHWRYGHRRSVFIGPGWGWGNPWGPSWGPWSGPVFIGSGWGWGGPWGHPWGPWRRGWHGGIRW